MAKDLCWGRKFDRSLRGMSRYKSDPGSQIVKRDVFGILGARLAISNIYVIDTPAPGRGVHGLCSENSTDLYEFVTTSY